MSNLFSPGLSFTSYSDDTGWHFIANKPDPEHYNESDKLHLKIIINLDRPSTVVGDYERADGKEGGIREFTILANQPNAELVKIMANELAGKPFDNVANTVQLSTACIDQMRKDMLRDQLGNISR